MEIREQRDVRLMQDGCCVLVEMGGHRASSSLAVVSSMSYGVILQLQLLSL